MNRFYISPEDWDESALKLTGDEAHHCAKVFRTTPGSLIEVFDGQGNAAQAEVLEVSSRIVALKVRERLKTSPIPVSVTLAQAVPKGKAMDLIAQKAAEIGASRIIPLETERTVMRLSEMAKKRSKWERIALESCKQCGGNWLPEIAEPMKLANLPSTCDSEVKLVAALTEKTTRIAQRVEGSPKSVTVVIGPEGDFSPGEEALLVEAGYEPVSLGPNVLRAETASFYALSLLSDQLFR